MDLSLVRTHLRIDDEHSENDFLQHLVNAAKTHVEQHCDRRIVDVATSDREMEMTDDVKHAILLLVGHWYSNRESVVVGVASSQVQLGVERLLWCRKRF